MKPRTLLASAVDAAFFAAVCAAFGLALAGLVVRDICSRTPSEPA